MSNLLAQASALIWRGLLTSAPGAAPAPMATRGIDVSALEGLNRWLVELHNDHRTAYALAVVGVLLIVGALLGLFSEALLSLAGWGTEPIERLE
ncbi:MAG: hypothetical protein ACYS8K_03740 [Planctomycetota bacterium]|jgi:hypothetical protein